MKRRLLATVALFPLTAAPSLAQDAFALDELVLSSSLSPVPAQQSAPTVELILEDSVVGRDTTLRQTLDREPGVTFSANGGLGANTTLRIRGLDTSYIGTRLDGIDVTDPSSGQTSFNFGGLVGAGLGRVEVLKGAQSALYGSEAIGGVVNLQSWRPMRDGMSGQVVAEGGSFGTFVGSASVGHRDDRGEVALTLGTVTTEGISARAGNDEKDGFQQQSLTYSGRYQATDTLVLGLNGFWRDSEIEIDRSSTNPAGENFTLQRGARIFAELQTGAVTHRFSYSGFDSNREDPTGSTTFFDGTRREAEYRLSAQLGAMAEADFGLSRTVESIETSSVSYNEESVNSVFGELRLTPTEAATVSLALRRDDNSDFGAKTTGRVALTYALQDDLILRAVAGTGYRAPSLFERYSSFGNPDLQPETSRSVELGIEKRFADRGFVKATLFYSEIDDLIDYDFATASYNQVPGLTVSEGVELSGAYAVTDRLTFSGSYTLTNAENEGERLVRVPRHDLVLGVDAQLTDRLSGNAEIQRVADVDPSESAPADHKVGDYTLLNLGVAYDIADTSELYLRVENALDEDYETAGGFNMPGRGVYFGVRASF